MKKKVIIAVIILVAVGGLMLGRGRLITYYSQQTGLAESRGKYADAINSFNKVVLLESLVPLNPNKSKAYTYRGRLYFNNGNTNQALEDLNTAIKLNKKNPDAHFGIALIRLQEGDLKQAIKELDIVIKESKDKGRKVEAYLSRQVAHRKLGDKDKAVADLKKVLELDPKNEPAKNALRMLEQ